jgi:diguanylate cyclase (GGDEF)-like protein/PAS domain S-box-containing protein
MNKKIMDCKNWITSKFPLLRKDGATGNMRGFNLIFVLAFLFIIFFAVFAFKEISQLMSANLWVRHTYEAIRETNESLYAIADAETHQRGFLITSDKQYIAERDAAIRELQVHLKKLADLVPDNPLQFERVVNFTALASQRIDLLNQVIQGKDSNSLLTADALAIFNRGQIISDHVKYLGQEIKAVEQVLLSERAAQVIASTKLANSILIVGNIVSFLFLLAAFILFNRELKKRISSESSRKDTESQMRSIIEGANDMIAAVDMNYRFIVFNEAYQREFKSLFGKTIVLGMSLKEEFTNQPEVQKRLLSLWQPTLEGKEYTRNIECAIANEGNTYEITSNSVANTQGTQIGAIHIIRNISRRIQEQAKLKNYYEQVQAGMQELQSKNQQITMLVEMSDNMLACASPEELSEVITKSCQRMLGFSSGYLYVMQPSKNYLEITASWGSPNMQDKIFSPDQCWAIRRGRTHEVQHAHNELICSHISNTDNKLSYFCIPLMAQNDIYGLLFMELEEAADKYSDNTKLLVNAFCELSALALANVRLRENLRYQSIRDPLTALYNRRYLEDFLFKQINQAERMKNNLAVLMLDLDHFKKINDSFGHDAGDAALKEVGRLLQNDIRMGDLAARYGGEEFILVFYNVDLDVAKMKSEQIRQEITAIQIKYGTQHVGPISISIGIAVYPEHGKSAEELIEAADRALYVAKNTGRNKVVVAGEEQNSSE